MWYLPDKKEKRHAQQGHIEQIAASSNPTYGGWQSTDNCADKYSKRSNFFERRVYAVVPKYRKKAKNECKCIGPQQENHCSGKNEYPSYDERRNWCKYSWR